MNNKKNVAVFSKDAQQRSGYVYTTNGQLSSSYANARLSAEVRKQLGDVRNKTIIDVGCGDGAYTIEFLSYEPRSILGIDPSAEAIATAKKRSSSKKIAFQKQSIYSLSRLKMRFDIAVIRGVLHHVSDPARAIHEVASIAKTIIIVEPNGYNPLLKIIEKISPYHRAHEEQSYFPHRLDQWVRTAGGKIKKGVYCGLVPFFCPNFLARMLKYIEPAVEGLPLINQLLCAVYVMKIRTDLTQSARG